MNASLTPHPSTLSTLYTIGHSNRTLDAFIAILRAHGIEYLVDVRTIPRSRHNPQFNLDALPASLAEFSINWEHRAGLGGLRHACKDSPNQGWRNASFRGYADYMQTPEFTAEIEALTELARRERTAIMCAEAVPWRCHRSLIADALTVRGIAVRHIMSEKTARPHTLTSFAQVEGTRISYPFALNGDAVP
ncbi:MAG: DUF488 family protein [Gammaproteobacteria bacterium]